MDERYTECVGSGTKHHESEFAEAVRRVVADQGVQSVSYGGTFLHVDVRSGVFCLLTLLKGGGARWHRCLVSSYSATHNRWRGSGLHGWIEMGEGPYNHKLKTMAIAWSADGRTEYERGYLEINEFFATLDGAKLLIPVSVELGRRYGEVDVDFEDVAGTWPSARKFERI